MIIILFGKRKKKKFTLSGCIPTLVFTFSKSVDFFYFLLSYLITWINSISINSTIAISLIIFMFFSQFIPEFLSSKNKSRTRICYFMRTFCTFKIGRSIWMKYNFKELLTLYILQLSYFDCSLCCCLLPMWIFTINITHIKK